AVLLLSSTPATVTPTTTPVRQFFLQDLSSLQSSFASCSQCCVVVEFHSSHSYSYAYASSRPHFR
ncbi:MAG: hypothetical protein ACK56F_28740, partial [bacterium]